MSINLRDLLKIREVEEDLELLTELLDNELCRSTARKYPLPKRRSGDLIHGK